VELLNASITFAKDIEHFSEEAQTRLVAYPEITTQKGRKPAPNKTTRSRKTLSTLTRRLNHANTHSKSRSFVSTKRYMMEKNFTIVACILE
jgi:hypothetical protein